MTAACSQTPSDGTAMRWIGGAMLVHYAIVAALHVATGQAAGLLWMSYLAHLLAAIGLLFGRGR